MDAFASQRMRGLHPGFRKRRVRVDRFAELARGELGADRRRGGCDQLRGVRPHRRCAEQPFGIRVGDPFDETGRLAGGESLAEAGEAELAGLDRAFLGGGVGFAQSDGRDFGRGENDVGDQRRVPARLAVEYGRWTFSKRGADGS